MAELKPVLDELKIRPEGQNFWDRVRSALEGLRDKDFRRYKQVMFACKEWSETVVKNLRGIVISHKDISNINNKLAGIGIHINAIRRSEVARMRWLGRIRVGVGILSFAAFANVVLKVCDNEQRQQLLDATATFLDECESFYRGLADRDYDWLGYVSGNLNAANQTKSAVATYLQTLVNFGLIDQTTSLSITKAVEILLTY